MKSSILISMWLATILAVTSASAEPLFPNSVVSNDLAFIKPEDKSVEFCVKFQGKQRAEMPDKRHDELFAKNVAIYSARYADGTRVGYWVHPDISSKRRAKAFVKQVATAVSKLPTRMRERLNHVVIHKGNETAFAESSGHFFILYSENILTRLLENDLEETVFHESVHATLDQSYLKSKAWKNAQKLDQAYITQYAARSPKKEDMAESALFAWVLLEHQGRLPSRVEKRAKNLIPNRLEFFKKVFKEQKRPAKTKQNTKC